MNISKIASVCWAYHEVKVSSKFLQRMGMDGNGVPFIWDLGTYPEQKVSQVSIYGAYYFCIVHVIWTKHTNGIVEKLENGVVGNGYLVVAKI